MKLIPIDFEYTGTSEATLDLVCCSVGDKDFWLYKDETSKQQLKSYLEKLSKDKNILLSYNFVAEGGSIYSLNIDPTTVKAVDLFLEYRNLLNHNHELSYGEQLIKGKVKNTRPPLAKWQMTEEMKKKSSFDDPEENLAAACFKLLSVRIDTEEKEFIRNIIIEGDSARINSHRERILKYCRSDIKYLMPMYNAIVKHYKKLLSKQDFKTLGKDMLGRAQYAALTSIMERRGYPVNPTAMRNFSDSVELILDSCIRDIRKSFKDTFYWNKSEGRWSMNQKYLAQYISETQDTERWMKTDKGGLSLSLDAWTQVFNFSHDYPKNILGAQIVRYLKLKQQLNGFRPKKDSKTIWSYTGSDGRVRPYMNIYGAQSSRSQPSATSFIPLKSAWMRVLIEPKPGRAIASIDYSSQEFLIGALDSCDKVMIDAYHSGDPYLYFGKKARMIPEHGTKASHPLERDKAKGTTLSMQYGMTKVGLAKKLTLDTGIETTEDEAQQLIDLFCEVFNVMIDHQEQKYQEYLDQGYLRLDDGWYMFGDNRNERSVKNVRTQGKGAVIMRKAVALCHQRGLHVLFTLHDALYIEYDSHDLSAIDTLRECMDEAFRYYYKKHKYEDLAAIRMEAFAWSPDYQDGKVFTPKNFPVDIANKYIDDRSKKEYEFFKSYFDKNKDLELI